MRSETVERQLAELGGAPAVSILWSLDNRRPGNTHDPAVLAELRTRAGVGIRRVLDGDAAASLVASVDDALDSVDLQHPGRAVAVLVSPSVSRVVTLDTPVETRVVVGDRFAIHDVVAAMSHRIRARIVVLSRAKTRCIDVDGESAAERLDLGFPVEAVAPTEADTPHRDFPLSEREDAEAARFVFRVVGRALSDVQNARPSAARGRRSRTRHRLLRRTRRRGGTGRRACARQLRARNAGRARAIWRNR